MRPTIKKGDMVRYEFRRIDGTVAKSVGLKYAYADESNNQLSLGKGVSISAKSVTEIWRQTGTSTYSRVWKKKDEGTKNASSAEEHRNAVKIEALGLSNYVYGVLKRAGIDSTDRLQILTAGELKKINGIGKTSAKEIEQKLNEKGLGLKK